MTAPRRYIALEEHCMTPGLQRVHDDLLAEHGRFQPAANVERLLDVDAARIEAMDAAGIDVQVLSHHSPGAQISDPRAVEWARTANDELAAAIARHPSRFAGFATLATGDADAAASELIRCVEQLGFTGTMIHGQAGGGFLDHPRNEPVLRAASQLGVPIYVHPAEPPEAVKDAYFRDVHEAGPDAERMEHMFATAGWGWHVETGSHALRMILGGVFDRHPNLQVILGHWGELIPFYLGRVDIRMKRLVRHLRKSPAQYFAEHFHVTPGGIETIQPLLLTLATVGADRVLYSADYPFGAAETAGRAYIEDAPISEADKSKIAHLNAEKLLRI
ncbi:amidohydrolase family protein [Conexibacter sp. CPCC 206217]|uniref:amidohydrolase family protein n=1 Tax=Conexibacter sp. CPCC 206217 TaxID=3064574 RepID=UPI002721D6DC|nr:amidohydrolase family protein [Conexibacter sp. CPCC 206217]MDO8212063.1 amidohydrolase family protein [Conexibacter sp. CPCC 206217]